MHTLYKHIEVSFTLVFILLAVILILKKCSTPSFNKMSPFECGFWPASSSRLPFSLQFFLISLVFLIFDVELMLLFPMLLVKKNHMLFSAGGMSVFIVILLGGLFLEWSQGSLEWLK